MSTVRLRHLADVNPLTPAFDRLANDEELTFLPMEAVWPGERLDISRRRVKASVATGYTRFQNSDVLVPKITPTFEAGRAVLIHGLHRGVGTGSTELHVLRPGPLIDPRFLLYVVNTHSFLKKGEAEMYGVAGQQRVPDAFLRDLLVDLPPLEEQRHIADFLDAETSRINAITNAMRSEISLLIQRRVQTIDRIWEHAKSAPRMRLGYATSLVTSGSRGWSDYVSDSGALFFRSANLRPDSIQPKLTNAVYVQIPALSATEAIRARIADGDVLVGITGANCGWVALADGAVAGGYVSQHVCLVRPDEHRISGEWLTYLIASPSVQDRLMGSQYGGTKTQLSLPDIRDLRVPVLPITEQKKLSGEITRQVSRIDNMRSLRSRQLDLLAERRLALITAAVTGQIDVSTASGRGIEE
ncbi:restriction endonuclease subunit S [Streptomyces sp. NPDC020490]|uniref:restriction endonuclease subunit S n=1 Tax=Streptomyces sp. NPDC020490 TaxID=3365078 RepID=UPI0037B6932B